MNKYDNNNDRLNDIMNILRNTKLDDEAYYDILLKIKSHIPKEQTNHTQALIYNKILKKYINVDKGISELLFQLWNNDISTLLSCENNIPKDYIWINFSKINDLTKFLKIIFKDINRNTDIYKRAFGFTNYDENKWLYDTPYNDADMEYDEDMEENENKYITNLNLNISPSLRFPSSDYEFILNQINNYNL